MDFASLFLFELILMRMSGFIAFNPIFGRSNMNNYVRAGIILVLSISVFSASSSVYVEVPKSTFEFMIKLILELGIGFVLGFLFRLFMMIVTYAGEIIDTQMGTSMAQTYDASSQVNMSITASLFNVLFVVLFFVQNGHYTLLRLMLTSGDVLSYGTVTFNENIASFMLVMFVEVLVLAMKLALPILAAELLGVIGMGILMKAIPQINAFVINMELKVIIGLLLVFFMLVPISEYMLMVEADMLLKLREALDILQMN